MGVHECYGSDISDDSLALILQITREEKLSFIFYFLNGNMNWTNNLKAAILSTLHYLGSYLN